MLFNNGLCTVITFINDPLHFTVDRCSNLFTITSGGMTKISSDKEKKITAFHEAGHAILFHVLPDVGPVYSVSIIPTELRYHGFGVCCCLLDILGCPGCNIIKDQLFCQIHGNEVRYVGSTWSCKLWR